MYWQKILASKSAGYSSSFLRIAAIIHFPESPKVPEEPIPQK
jgi:hypothetical protein